MTLPIDIDIKILVFDISNLLHRTFFAQKGEDDETLAGLATHTALVTLNKYFKMYKPDVVIMAFDRSSWRKEYTASDVCISKKPYKGTRRQDMTPAQQAKYKRFLGHLAELECLIRDYTTIVTLAADKLEADDLIGGVVRLYNAPDTEITIISSDSDLLQLARYQNVKVISPATDKEQSLADYDNDPVYYLFQKCVKGDPTDNVQSAYPRVRTTRIRKAYEDSFERVQLMNETWTDQTGRELRVGDVYKENELLIDLSKQPEYIQKIITDTVSTAMSSPRTFSMFHILKFIGKYKLTRIRDGIDQYIPLLSQGLKK